MVMMGYDNADIKVTMGGIEVGTMQSISIETEPREPVYIESIGEMRTTFGYPTSVTMNMENVWMDDKFYRYANATGTTEEFKKIHSDTLDKMFKSVTMKKNWNNEDYAAELLQQGDLF